MNLSRAFNISEPPYCFISPACDMSADFCLPRFGDVQIINCAKALEIHERGDHTSISIHI